MRLLVYAFYVNANVGFHYFAIYISAGRKEKLTHKSDIQWC